MRLELEKRVQNIDKEQDLRSVRKARETFGRGGPATLVPRDTLTTALLAAVVLLKEA